MGIYYYLKEKLKVESKMLVTYLPVTKERRYADEKCKGKEKEVYKGSLRRPIDYIAEDLTCAITYEAVSDLYLLSCQHFLSSQALLLL